MRRVDRQVLQRLSALGYDPEVTEFVTFAYRSLRVPKSSIKESLERLAEQCKIYPKRTEGGKVYLVAMG